MKKILIIMGVIILMASINVNAESNIDEIMEMQNKSEEKPEELLYKDVKPFWVDEEESPFDWRNKKDYETQTEFSIYVRLPVNEYSNEIRRIKGKIIRNLFSDEVRIEIPISKQLIIRISKEEFKKLYEDNWVIDINNLTKKGKIYFRD
ncbi:MAG: hypothetical protein ACQEQD_06730 [Bacillota bacterium]